MNRPVKNGLDPFGRPMAVDLGLVRKRRKITDYNTGQPNPAKRKSIPSTVIKHSQSV